MAWHGKEKGKAWHDHKWYGKAWDGNEMHGMERHGIVIGLIGKCRHKQISLVSPETRTK
jgi:hypothetical protein